MWYNINRTREDVRMNTEELNKMLERDKDTQEELTA